MVLKNLDFVVAVLALPLFIVADLPIVGWVTGAGIYALQRGISAYATRRAVASGDTRTIVGVLAGSMIGRGWLVAFTIFAVGVLVDNDAGLSAAVLFVALFTVYFTVRMIVRPFEKETRSR